MYRADGSVQSANSGAWDKRYQVRDFGLYRGVVRDVIYTDADENDSGADAANEVVYNVMIIGGHRDGQLFNNARLLRKLGGYSNFEETTLKKVEGLTKLDPSSSLALADLPIANMHKWNGDVVYIQFLNGDLSMPIIIGLGYHQAAEPEAEESDGPRYRHKFNGVFTEINKDGEFSWSKDNGAYLPVGPNTANPLYPFVAQFVPLPGQKEAVKVTLNNQYAFKFEYPLLGLNVAIDGLADSFAFTTSAGAALKITGLATDSFELTTLVGTALKVEGGATDAITLGTAVGAAIKIDGTGDSISFSVAFGDSLSVSAKDGIQASTPTGTSLSMKSGAVEIGSGGQAKLLLDKTGFIKLGNSSGDVLKDILGELIKSLSTATYSGFGAPGSNVADLVQLVVKLQLITG